MKKLNNVFIVFGLLVFAMAIGITSLQPEEGYELLSNPVVWLVFVAALFLILSFLAVFKAMETLQWLVKKNNSTEAELEEEEPETEDFFSKLWQKLQDSRPIEEEAEIDLDHSYDGIRELDNNLPPWWLIGFYLSMLFAIVYVFRYHITGNAPLQIEEYKLELAEAEKAREEYLKNAADLVDETNVVVLTDEIKLKEGGKIYNEKCAVCHLKDGGGLVGPNLSDEYWLHGGDVKDIFTTIKYGITGKGMREWKSEIGAADMQKVASYILSFQGTTPANPKDAEGDLYKPALAETTDTTAVQDSL